MNQENSKSEKDNYESIEIPMTELFQNYAISPVDLWLPQMIPISYPNLQWFYMGNPCRKIKLYNTGFTVTIKARWEMNRPFLQNGPLKCDYVFSQMHFHWGRNNLEGSEHTFDGVKYPLEMHVVFFKACYRYLPKALEENDGIVILVYIYDLTENGNKNLQFLIDGLSKVKREAGSSAQLKNIALGQIVPQFYSDYFMYWGRIYSKNCFHLGLWIICRHRLAISKEQLDIFRSIRDQDRNRIISNYRNTNDCNHPIFHVNASIPKHCTQLRDFLY